MQKKESVKIRLFGTCTIEYQEKVYNLNNHLTKQSLAVFKIFILNYKRPISNEWIMQIFWKDKENPANSLKFSIFRLRKSLKKIPALSALEIIKTTNEGYELNSKLNFIIDTYEFQQNSTHLLNVEKLTQESFLYAEKMDALYKGTLKIDTDYVWFILIQEFYRGSYLDSIKMLYVYYDENKEYEKLKKLSIKAATIEPTVEENHLYYIQSLISLNEIDKAFEYYQKSTKMLIDEYALALSDKMLTLHDFLIVGLENVQSSNIITEYYKNKDYVQGALYCNNSIFEYIYDLNLRNANRLGQKYYLYIFEVKSNRDLEPFIPRIRDCFQKTLRSGDVFTRINKYQFLVLLPCDNDEIAHMIARRISSCFRKKISKEIAQLYYHLENTIK